MSEIDWTKQHCGVHQAPNSVLRSLMPDLVPVLDTFPEDETLFTWDVKVHMLMPRQYPCIPHWHVDNVPRVNGIQRFDKVDLTKPMYMWLSGGPLTQFEDGYVLPRVWHRFTQADRHRGTAAGEFCWRAFIRATHRSIQKPKEVREFSQYQRRHCQVYLDEDTYQW